MPIHRFVKATGMEERQDGLESSMMTDDMRMMQERERWEREAQADKPLNLHYDTSKEIRTMGVGINNDLII
jgi:DNA-binding HxlR family transcriptional regulator